MKRFVLIWIFIFAYISVKSFAQNIIWSETFDVPEKGYWGGGSDITGITKWTIDVANCTLANASDFIKTVSTSGGRMQAVDIDGEAIWASEPIDISAYSNVSLTVDVSETGSSTNANKYVKVYYAIDGAPEALFETNGNNTGNYGNVIATQSKLNGNIVQLIVKINNPNASDAAIFDNLIASYDNQAPQISSVTAINANTLKIQFSEQLSQTQAETISNYSDGIVGLPSSATLNPDKSSVELIFASGFTENQSDSITVSNIQDLSGNIMPKTISGFIYIPFVIEEAYVVNKNELILEFSHSLEQSSAETSGNYLVNDSIGNPLVANLLADSLVHLTFGDFVSNTSYSIASGNLKDVNGITMDTTNTGFIFHQIQASDLVINEIMVDPTPSVDLPEYEYIELFNRTNYDLSLYNWKAKIGKTNKAIPLCKIKANTYVILNSYSGTVHFTNFGQSIGISSNLNLTNSGKEVAIISNEDILVDSLRYSDQWYQDTDKDAGGWSLERIDPDNSCGKLNNWKASINLSGGTPCSLNSVNSVNIDNQAPILVKMNSVVSSNEIQLCFNEELDETNLADINNYLLDGSIYPQYTYLLFDEIATIGVVFQDDFSEGEHSLQLFNIEDLCANSIVILDTSFTYYPGNEFDVVINELMVDVGPSPNVLPASKYIEIYNRTQLNIDLSGWSIQIGENTPYIFSDFKIKSNGYLILCSEDGTSNLETYGNTIGALSESQLTNTGKALSLFNSKGQLIDYVNYTDSWYADESKEDGGWSLERIDIDNFCGATKNWKASVDYKGGTPGQQNSVNSTNLDKTVPLLLELKILTSYKLALTFSKNIIDTTALADLNYRLDDGMNKPVIIEYSDTSRATVIIQFAGQFIDSREQTIQIKNLQDFCGNNISDTLAPFIYYLVHPKEAYAVSANVVRLMFSEEVEIVTAQASTNYVVNDGIGSPSSAYKQNERKNVVYLEFPVEFTSGKNYRIRIENVKDLSGNSIKPVELSFSYFVPSRQDIVINELLFNPKPEGIDFVEIYNKANMPVDLSKLKLARRDDEGKYESIKVLSESNLLLAPGHFLAISSDTSKTKSDYPAAVFDQFVQIPVLPAYNDDEGIVVLLYGDSVIDEFAYNEKMHFALIADNEGISLERIDPEKATDDLNNWHSAAESYGFATPANQNSQFRHLSDGMDSKIVIEPETFSPNNDGYEDVVFIRYKFDEPGYVANVSIYDGKGRIVKRIATNELLAAESEFSWDGLTEDGTKALIGIYVIYFEVFNLRGEVRKTKKTCVLASRLN